MNNMPTFPGEVSQEEPQAFSSFTSQEGSDEGIARLLHVWYRMTSPPAPGDSASFEEREVFRRGRTGSQISIVLFILIFISYPAAFAGSNSLLAMILTLDLFILALALFLNHLGRCNVAGILVVLAFTASPTVNIVTTPGGVNTSALPIFGLLVFPLMCAVSFLPSWWVFVIATGNCLFAFSVLRFLPSSGELHEVLKVAFPGVVTPIVLSQVIVSLVAFLWVHGATQALLRAERAEEIAKLEHDLVLQNAETVAEQKQQLDLSIQSIVETHARVANGDFNARVPLTQENALWQISGSLNNLLSRLQRLRQEAGEIQQMQISLKEAREEVALLRRLAGKEAPSNEAGWNRVE
jgi:hypothetical protein